MKNRLRNQYRIVNSERLSAWLVQVKYWWWPIWWTTFAVSATREGTMEKCKRHAGVTDKDDFGVPNEIQMNPYD